MKRFRRLTFGEYIKELPSAIVFRNLLKEKKKERRIISTGLIDRIKTEFAPEDSLKIRFDTLRYEVKKICALTYLFGSCGLKAVEFDRYHEELLNSFLIYSAHDKYGANYYFGFRDIEQILSGRLAAFLFESAKTDAEAKPAPFLTMRCLNDFTVVLIQALKGGLKRKRDGGLVTVAVTELRKRLHATVETCMFAKKEKDLTQVIDLLLAYGVNRGYVSEGEKSYTTTDEQVHTWLSRSTQESYNDFNNFAVEYCGMGSALLLNAVLDAAGASWLSSSFFPVSCREKAVSILQVFHYLGIIEACAIGTDIVWRRNTTTAGFFEDTAKQRVMIMPDFSAVLPQEVLPETLYSFSLSGIIQRLDRVYKGCIDRDTVNESLSRGVKEDVLIDRLGRWGAPENIKTTVKEWIREFSRLCLIDAAAIITFDEKTGRQIRSYHPLSDMVEPVDAESVFIVKKGREREVRDLLTAMGFDPRVPEIQQPKPVSAAKMLMEDIDEELTLSLEFQAEQKILSHTVPSGKYSAELKKLEINELFHVIDYAILMGHRVKIEYEGSPYLKQGQYTLTPLQLVNGLEPYVEGKIEGSGLLKKYYIKKIKRIGVRS